MFVKTFEDLVCWQKGHQWVLEIYRLSRQFPIEERYGITCQLRRSAVSVCANIAEGYKKTRLEFIRFLSISVGSLEESKYHMLLCRDLGYLSEQQFDRLNGQAQEIGRILYGLTRSLKPE